MPAQVAPVWARPFLFPVGRILLELRLPFAVLQTFTDETILFNSIPHPLRITCLLHIVNVDTQPFRNHIDPLGPTDLSPNMVSPFVDKHNRHLVNERLGFDEPLYIPPRCCPSLESD